MKFSKIGALTATGTRPYAKGADGLVMGDGAGFFVIKRLAVRVRLLHLILVVGNGVLNLSLIS